MRFPPHLAPRHRYWPVLLVFWAGLLRADTPFEIGMTPNLYATDLPLESTTLARRDQVRRAGATFHFYSPRWSELETAPGVYDFAVFDLQVARAQIDGLPLLVNFKVVDTVRRTMPEDLESLNFDHPTVTERLKAMLHAFVPRLGGRARWVSLGNEINVHLSRLSSPETEAAAYLALYQAGAEQVKAEAPGTLTTVTFTAGAFNQDFTAPLRNAVDLLCLTFYPMETDYTARSPSIVDTQFPQMKDAAGAAGKKILFQEVGYPSGADNASNETLQAEFYRTQLSGES